MDRAPFDMDRVLSGIKEIVTDIDVGVSSFSTFHAEGIPASSVRVTSLDALLSPTRDGFVDLAILDDNMSVVGDFYPPLGAGNGLTVDAVEVQLEKLGVVSGILLPALRAAVTSLNIDRRPIEDVVVAKGTPAVDEIPERWEVLPELLERKRILDETALTLDFKKESPFVLVKKGDLLAARFPEQFGSRGRDVLGNEIEPHKLNPPVLRAGDNVDVRADGFRATCEGCLRVTENVVSVDRVLVLSEGVDYRTGNIQFPGDVQILGPVAPGFTIEAQGSVYCSQVLDATEIATGGDLVTQFGIVGQESCRLIIGGAVRTKFIERATLKVQGLVQARNSIHNSLVQTRDKVVMGNKSVIMGGRIEAQNGMVVFQVGTDRSVKTELICGMDFEVIEKISWAQEKCLELVKRMKQLGELAKAHPEQAPKIQQAMGALRSKVSMLSEASRHLAVQMDRNDECAVAVHGTISAGTYIEICHVSYVVPQSLTRVRFFLDKRRGEVSVAPL